MTVLATVTDIEHVGGSRRARRIWLDDEPFRTTSAAVVKKLGLMVGDSVEPEQLAADCDAAERAAARERAIGLLARREYSAHQLAQRLRDDGYSDSSITETLDHLIASGLLDDRRFAAALVRTRVRAGYGPRFIRRDLERAGVSKAIADAALREACEDLGATSGVEAAARRLARRTDDVQHLAARLARRGFDADDAVAAARAVLDRLSSSSADEAGYDGLPSPDDVAAP